MGINAASPSSGSKAGMVLETEAIWQRRMLFCFLPRLELWGPAFMFRRFEEGSGFYYALFEFPVDGVGRATLSFFSSPPFSSSKRAACLPAEISEKLESMTPHFLYLYPGMKISFNIFSAPALVCVEGYGPYKSCLMTVGIKFFRIKPACRYENRHFPRRLPGLAAAVSPLRP